MEYKTDTGERRASFDVANHDKVWNSSTQQWEEPSGGAGDISGKADKIVQQQQGIQTMFDYFHAPVPSILELPAGTEHTITITEADIAEIQPYIITSGITPANPARIRFSSVSGDFYVEYRAVPGRRPNVDGVLMVVQKNPDGTFSGNSIYSGPVQGGGTIHNMTVTQIDWLSFSNYDMAFLIENMNITPAQVRELNLWKKIQRSQLVESIKNLDDVRNDVFGELTSATNTFNNITVNGISKIGNNVQLQQKIDADDLAYLFDHPDEATDGVMYLVEDGTIALKMYIKDGDIIKQLGGTSYTPLTGTWAINPDDRYEATFTLDTPIVLGNGLRLYFDCVFSVDYDDASFFNCLTKDVVIFDSGWHFIQIGQPFDNYPTKWVHVQPHITNGSIDSITLIIEHENEVINFFGVNVTDIRAQAI